MSERRPLLDLGVVSVVLLSVAAAAYVLMAGPKAAPAASGVVPSSAPSPAATAASTAVTLVRMPGTPAGHVDGASREAGWVVTSVLADDARLAERARTSDLVLVQAGQQGDAAGVVQRLRAADPGVRIVVVGPLVGLTPATLRGAVLDAGGEFREASGWVPPGGATPTGSLTEEGARVAAAALVRAVT